MSAAASRCSRGPRERGPGPTAAPDVPPGPARIEGVVLRAETGEPVAGAEVALYALTAEGVPGLRRTASDGAGRFAFENVANDPAIGWLVGARFEGVAFPGGRVASPPGRRRRRSRCAWTSRRRSARGGRREYRPSGAPAGRAPRDRDALARERRQAHLLRAGGSAGSARRPRTVLPRSAAPSRCRSASFPKGSCGRQPPALVRAGVARLAGALVDLHARGPKRRATEGPSASPSRSRVPENTGRLACWSAIPTRRSKGKGSRAPRQRRSAAGRSSAGRSRRRGPGRSGYACRSRSRASRPRPSRSAEVRRSSGSTTRRST